MILQQVATASGDGVVACSCELEDSVDDCVYVAGAMGGRPYVRRCDILDPAKMPAVGIIIRKKDSTTCYVKVAGTIPVVAPLTPGARYWVGPTGKPTSVMPSPSATRWCVQFIGMAVSTQQLWHEFVLPTVRVVA